MEYVCKFCHTLETSYCCIVYREKKLSIRTWTNCSSPRRSAPSPARHSYRCPIQVISWTPDLPPNRLKNTIVSNIARIFILKYTGDYRYEWRSIPWMLGDDVANPENFSRGVGDSSSVLTNWKHPKIVDRRPPDRSLDASSTLDFGKKDGRAARGTGIRLSPTFCETKV